MLCALNPEDLVAPDHPLRGVKALADEALRRMDGRLERMYSVRGRPSVPPERLLKSMLLMALYSIRSDRQLCEQVRYNLLFRWFLDMEMTEAVWDRSSFSHNRERLLQHDVARELFGQVVEQAREQDLVSAEHFSVDGTLIEAWASNKSFRPKDSDDDDRNGWGDFRGQKRSNETHESKTDPEAKLMRKGGQGAKLSFMGHALAENRHGLVVDFCVTEADGYAERRAALQMLDRQPRPRRRCTLGADAGYDSRDFVEQCRARELTPHVAQKPRSAIDERTTRFDGYMMSLRVRRRVEQVFGWAKCIGGLHRTRFKGRRRTELGALLTATAYNLLRISNLLHPAPTT
jgi:transposase